MNLFVPGRICLFGEHSDWAGGYRRINSDLEKGFTIITGTNQGLHADVQQHPTKLILKTTLRDGSRIGPFEVEMNQEKLFAEAQKGEFFSYACGVAYQVSTHYHVRGLAIDNYKTDLPVKKGLSSSAAICVLVARAFNRLYDLKMTVRGEMEYAYQGEITTPSRCGRMDQGCAYGSRPVLMVFDGDHIDIEELKTPNDLYWVVVDLRAVKDTKEILAKLNECYPFASTDLHNAVQRYLGSINKAIVNDAANALKKGDAEKLGILMTKAQENIDKYLQPACPSQLTAPILHKVLSHAPIKPYIYGGKGVGSQGDGCAQFIAKDEESQKKIIEILERDLSMPCLPVTIKSSHGIKKVVIPAAGFGTRLFPASKAIKKELFPIIDSTGRAKPAILIIIEEAFASGIEEAAVVVQKRDLALFEDFFYKPPLIENYNKLSKENREYSDYLLDLGHRITLVTQEVQEGFGHAVYCAHDWADGEPFLLMLGDHIYSSDSDLLCSQQLFSAYERFTTNIVGLKITHRDDIKNFGCVAGIWQEQNSLLTITEFCEKPSVEYAEEHLRIDGLQKDYYLSVFGQYVLSPKIFSLLEKHIEHNIRERGEFQLTSCLEELRKEDGFIGCLVEGQSFDIGVPESYKETLMRYHG